MRYQVRLAAFCGCLCTAGVALAQLSTTSGTLTTGPEGQGSCASAGTDGFLCSNGAYCSWTGTDFSCVGGSGRVDTATSTSTATIANTSASSSAGTTGPPGYDCTSHGGHFDCTSSAGEELTCEQEDGTWICQSFAAASEGQGTSAASEEACVVHGGHTHGNCAGQCNNLDLGYYDLDLHIVSLFVLLVASFVGVFLPILAGRYLANSIFRWTFFITKYFGTGVILSTAFIHLLYHAFIMFANTCIGELAFEPAAPAISLAGLMIVFWIDYSVTRWLNSRSPRARHNVVEDPEKSSPPLTPFVHPDATCQGDDLLNLPFDPSIRIPRQETPRPSITRDLDHHHYAGGTHAAHPIDYASRQAHFEVLLLEAGIVFHSIMIGVTLGTSGGDQWQPLFIAVVFHQLFEGLALGSRLGQLIFPPGKGWKRYVMAIVYGVITSIGIGIGIGVHHAYNPNSPAALLSIGILQSISAGILLYSGIVELLVHDFMHGALAHAGKWKVAAAAAAMTAGMICMSVLGVWA